MEGIQRLKWISEFLNLDLENLSPGDQAKLAVEFRQYLYPDKDEIIFMGENKWVAQLPIADSEDFWNRVAGAQKFIGAILSVFYEIIGIEKERIDRPAYGRFMILENKGTGVVEVKFIPQVDGFHDFMEFKLLFDLNGLPAKGFHRCQGCEKTFFNPTKKEKKFCSSRCLWKWNARKRREADPERYRTRQREIMRGRYAAEKKKKLGPMVRINSKGGK